MWHAALLRSPHAHARIDAIHISAAKAHDGVLAVYTALESIEISYRFGSVTHGLRISLVWFLAAVPLGFTLMIYRLLQSMRRDLTDLFAGREVHGGAKLFDD